MTELIGSSTYSGDACPSCGYRYGHVEHLGDGVAAAVGIVRLDHKPVITVYYSRADRTIVGFRCPQCNYRYKPMKLCINCRWAVNRHPELPESVWDWRCTHTIAIRRPEPNYVTGKPFKPFLTSCDQTRLDPKLCGPEGRYWTAKEPTP